jgi:hypothetical protein
MRAHSCVRQGVWNIGRSRCDGKRSNASSGRVARRLCNVSFMLCSIGKIRTYLLIIFLSACARTFHENTLTSFSMLRGFGFGKPMIILKKSSLSALALDTVSGRNPSRFLRIRFFSSTVKRTFTNCSSRKMVSTLVMKHSSFSSHQMQLTQILRAGRASGAIGANDVVIVLPCCDLLNSTSRLFESSSSCVHSSVIFPRSPSIFSMAFV